MTASNLFFISPEIKLIKHSFYFTGLINVIAKVHLFFEPKNKSGKKIVPKHDFNIFVPEGRFFSLNFAAENLNPIHNMIIAIDFDGTIVEHRYPEIGREIPFATETLKKLIEEHHQLILWSVREGRLLDEAVEWCRQRGVEFYAVNKDFPEEDTEKNRHYSRKLKADLFIDDRNLGGLPDWGTIYRLIHERKSLAQLLEEEWEADRPAPRKKKKWWF